MDLLIKRDELSECRVVEGEKRRPGPGQVRLRVDSFGLSSNNITYAVLGDAMSYWSFFPAPEGWGRVPVWGFATVEASAHEEVAEGTRVYGYLPMSSDLIVTPERAGRGGFVDGAPHRSGLPAVYNAYLAVDADPGHEAGHEDEQMLLRPLFQTAFLIDDQLAEEGLLDTGPVLFGSASSKTALTTAHLLSRRGGFEVIGLTSPGNLEFVEGLGVYDRAVSYEKVGELPREGATYVDMSGDAAVRAAVHGHYGQDLAASLVVGLTHWESAPLEAEDLPGPEPTVFFAPGRAERRREDWGGEELGRRMAEAWRGYLEWTPTWLRVSHADGFEAIQRTYLKLLAGEVDPRAGHVLSPR